VWYQQPDFLTECMFDVIFMITAALEEKFTASTVMILCYI